MRKGSTDLFGERDEVQGARRAEGETYHEDRRAFERRATQQFARAANKSALPKLVHPILTSVGILSVVLGIIGIFLPLMPTTPFLLLAAFCFARSSQRWHDWLYAHRWFGPYLQRYHERHAMTRRDKLLTLLPMWLSIGLTAALVVHPWWAKLILIGIACGVTFHILRLQTVQQ